MFCALCMYETKDCFQEANKAITVLRGYAVCEDHISYLAQGNEWAVIMNAIRR